MSGSELVRHRVKQDWNRDSGESINRIANTAPPHSTIFTNNQSYPHSFNLTSDNQKSYLVGRRSSLSNNPLSNHMFCNSSPISSVPRSINNSNQFRSARPPKFIFQILLSFDEREKSCLQAVIHLRNLKNGIVHPKAITNQPTQSLASKSNNGSGKSNNSNIDKSSTEVKNVPRPKILYKIPNIIKREDESNRSSPLKSNDSFENQFSRKINLKENQRDPNLMGSLSKDLISNRRIINGFDRRHLIEQVVKIDWSDGTSESFDPTGLALDLILKKCYCFN
ncbi:hypothetical protein BY996DRAFT_2386349 [Phakopsora pachyrhizi]|nr:hypothetical protein BY996DRAFT_2386349 [Phakopsora pachyrhizi]